MLFYIAAANGHLELCWLTCLLTKILLKIDLAFCCFTAFRFGLLMRHHSIGLFWDDSLFCGGLYDHLLFFNDFKSASILDDSLLLKLAFILVRSDFGFFSMYVCNTDWELVHGHKDTGLSRGSNDCLFAAASWQTAFQNVGLTFRLWSSLINDVNLTFDSFFSCAVFTSFDFWRLTQKLR